MTDQEQRANDMLQAIAQQRNQALDALVSVSADLQAAQRIIHALQAQLAAKEAQPQTDSN